MNCRHSDEARLRRLYEECDFDIDRLAEKLGKSRATAYAALQKHQIFRSQFAPKTPPVKMHPSLSELHCDGNALVTADWHLPLTDYGIVEEAVNRARRMGVKKLVIAGDWFNLDSMSRFEDQQDSARLPKELSIANEMMEWLLTIFDEIYVSKGNHSVRIMRSLGFKLKFDHAIRMLLYSTSNKDMERIHITGRDYVVVTSEGGDPCRVAHTNSYSKLPLSIPSKLADRHRTDLIGAHRHHHAMGFSPSGYRIGEVGGFFDADATEYLIHWTNDFPRWTNGYFILADGQWIAPALCP